MSRSYRKPYASWCGHKHTASRDKTSAAQGVRRTQNAAIKQALLENTLDDLLLPHMYDCPWNEVYTWVRYGNNHLRFDSWLNKYSVYYAAVTVNNETEAATHREDLEYHHGWWLGLHHK